MTQPTVTGQPQLDASATSAPLSSPTGPPSGKSILIFSDGTGQAGGLRPDQRLSNVYKLYRAARSGPDSPIDPARQIAFYDSGLGTDADVGTIPLRLTRFIKKLASSATGAGISANVVDCYAAILKHYEPGDRIYLFGFSRGAYTVRCVAGVLQLCGVPTRVGVTHGCPESSRALRDLAEEAVLTVYEHGAGKPRTRYKAQRLELARRFRARHESDDGGQSNAAPYFIGVFDTVAALGAHGWARVVVTLTLLFLLTVAATGIAGIIGSATGAAYGSAFKITCLAMVMLAGVRSFFRRLKIIRDYPADPWWKRWHLAGWKLRFYDESLDRRVEYVRHALAIDEVRQAFARVHWGDKHTVYDHFVQMWFAGNHSDIGGSYPEDESRLSDIALSWMVEEVAKIPHPIEIDRTKLYLYPSPAGVQHCEVASLRDRFPRWARRL
ncbi:MAG: DUF2235 domain-containing protein, partial [Gemmatimonadales bacterium]|nr:DUF2235 domain-containing protein [Gemmatimonadales bacterium]